MTGSELRFNLARELAEQLPNSHIHVVTVGDDPDGPVFMCGNVGDEQFAFAQGQGFQKARQGWNGEVFDWFKEQVRWHIFGIPSQVSKPISVTYSPGRFEPLRFNTLEEAEDVHLEVTDR
jgi:hypothetical protein